jgi:heavy metal efflux system protein
MAWPRRGGGGAADHRAHRNPDERPAAPAACALLVAGGLSVVNLIFDDDSDNDWDRQKVLERLAQVTLPPNVNAQIGPDFSPIGSIYWYTLESTQSGLRRDGTEVSSGLGDRKYMKSVPDVVDDSSFGGITREYQVRVDPDKLISYGLSLAQVEQQLTNANANAGGSFIEQGASRSMCARWAWFTMSRTSRRPSSRRRTARRCASKTSPWLRRGPKIRLGQIGKAIHRADGVVVDDNDVVEGIVFLRKGADTAATLEGIHAMVRGSTSTSCRRA